MSRQQDAHVNITVLDQFFNGGLHFDDDPDRIIRRRRERATTINGDITLARELIHAMISRQIFVVYYEENESNVMNKNKHVQIVGSFLQVYGRPKGPKPGYSVKIK